MIGHHIILDVYECSIDKISFTEPVKQILNEICKILMLSKVSESYKQFHPVGVTGIILLEESHISIHTWPEYGYAALDIFSCRQFNNELLREHISNLLHSNNIITKSISRGDFVSKSPSPQLQSMVKS